MGSKFHDLHCVLINFDAVRDPLILKSYNLSMNIAVLETVFTLAH